MRKYLKVGIFHVGGTGSAPLPVHFRAFQQKYRKIGRLSFDIIKKKVIFVRFNAALSMRQGPSAINTNH